MSIFQCATFGLSAFGGHRGVLLLLAVALGTIWLVVWCRDLITAQAEHISAEELERLRRVQSPLPAELDFFD